MSDIPTSGELKTELPLTGANAALVRQSSQDAINILRSADTRLLVVVGPCSVHDKDGALEYASLLAAEARSLSERLLVVMRCYVEKSRTGLGWRGMARDLAMDGSLGAAEGVRAARSLMLGILDLGLPLAAELVSPFLWPYWADLLSYASVGARGVESQALREAAAFLPCACGFKNGRDGRIDTALNAASAAAVRTSVILHSDAGRVQERVANGNPCSHIILRGTEDEPNWPLAGAVANRATASGLSKTVMVDVSHGNSGGVPSRQAEIARSLLALRKRGVPLSGMMIESYIDGGRQDLQQGRKPLPRVSVTDPCLSWPETRSLLREIAER
ncbi:MAG TPA: 3-deoxy-7-phosphoheptulonate synthase [Spirochaetales bacterium]|nr:3-deoxy-7-phosphoheptulonate synthase [Spirochaetales bacterium]